jgi:hypothetical protein
MLGVEKSERLAYPLPSGPNNLACFMLPVNVSVACVGPNSRMLLTKVVNFIYNPVKITQYTEIS